MWHKKSTIYQYWPTPPKGQVGNVQKISKIYKNDTLLVPHGSVCTYCIIIYDSNQSQHLRWYLWMEKSWNIGKNQYFGLFFENSQLSITKTARRIAIFNRFQKFFQFFHQNNITHQFSFTYYVFEYIEFYSLPLILYWLPNYNGNKFFQKGLQIYQTIACWHNFPNW